MIELDVKGRRLHLDITEQELAQPPPRPPQSAKEPMPVVTFQLSAAVAS